MNGISYFLWMVLVLLGIIYGKQKLNNSREAIVKITKILENRKWWESPSFFIIYYNETPNMINIINTTPAKATILPNILNILVIVFSLSL